MPTINVLQKLIRARRPVSIQQRLPLLICILLVCTVVVLSWTSYLGVKKTSVAIGKERLRSLTAQLSTLLGQSNQSATAMVRAAAHGDSVKRFLLSNQREFQPETLEALKRLHRDSASVLVELLNARLQTVLQSGKPGVQPPLKASEVLAATPVKPDSGRVGKMYFERDSIFYPVIASITNDHQTIGYLIRWRKLVANPRSVSQLSELIGTGATICIGNADGSLLTDMMKPVQRDSSWLAKNDTFLEYTIPGGTSVIATSMPIANTKWVILVEFPKQKLHEAANRFLGWIVLIGLVVIAIGSFIAWLVSRKITKPLNQLTAAATSIASGDYSPVVQVARRDELGKLARAFNAMAIQVSNAQSNLEDKVEERTMQLETANRELEAFSYSVSHDLRAPLRAISGYAMMLKEDHEGKLDDEAKRLLNNIVTNTTRMGQLIDDLLAFSRMGKKELMPHEIDMKKLAQSCLDELLKNDNRYEIKMGNLPLAAGDQNLLKQVWMNLIDNAIKYSSKINTPQIEIGHREDRNNIVYYVRDNGVGFDMKYAHKLFGIFQRLHDQDSFEGTGIGLALVKRIVNKHKGEIWAEGGVDKGATFYFSLPRSIDALL